MSSRSNDWNSNPANPKVIEALDSTFEVRLTGMELQCVGTALETLCDRMKRDARRGDAVGELSPEQVLMACVKGIMVATGIADRLHQAWTDYVEGRMVAVSDMPPDPFRGDAAGPYL